MCYGALLVSTHHVYAKLHLPTSYHRTLGQSNNDGGGKNVTLNFFSTAPVHWGDSVGVLCARL